jgi:ATP-dependent RNA helicase DDX47/RRP3
LNDALCEACEKLGWKVPTKIQCEALPVALQSRFNEKKVFVFE